MKKKEKPTTTALIPKPSSTKALGRLVQVVLDVDLRAGHDKLLELGKSKGVHWEKLLPGQYVAFVNRHLNRFMLLGISPSRRGAVIVYYKSYAGRIDRQEMETIPQAFGAPGTFQLPNKGAEQRLDREFSFKRARRVGPEPVKKIGAD